MNLVLNGQECNCYEYLYLNEPTTDGAVHKYRIELDGTLTEIGNPWFDNSVANEGVVKPHGVIVDLNGFVYIGSDNADGTDIRKFNCDGEIIPASEFAITTKGQYNTASIDNNLFVNDIWANNRDISQYDLCTGELVASVSFCEDINSLWDWGFFIDPYTSAFYSTSAHDDSPSALYYYSIDDFDNDANTCINAVVDLEPYLVNGNDAQVYGVTTDIDGNVYIAIRQDGNFGSYMLKFGPAPTFNYIGASAPDANEDGSGYYDLSGIVYSESTGLLYTSSQSDQEDCISVFDTDLNYIGVGVGPSANGIDNGKGIAIITECCPDPINQVVDTVYCDQPANTESIYLSDLLPCSGTICEALWVMEPGATGITFDDCSQELSFNGGTACATFTKESAGTSSYAQCGAFELTLNVSVVVQPTITITGNQSICLGAAPTDLTATTDAENIQWQMSTTSCAGPWTDIAGEAGSTYTPSSGLSATTYYRAIATNNPDCGTGSCDTPSECITVTLEPIPCLPISITKNN